MGQSWLYYVPCVLQQGGKIGFFAHIAELDGPLNTPQNVRELISQLTKEHVNSENDAKVMPVVPLGWTLIKAQQGPAVRSHKRRRPSARDNGHGGPDAATVGEPSSP